MVYQLSGELKEGILTGKHKIVDGVLHVDTSPSMTTSTTYDEVADPSVAQSTPGVARAMLEATRPPHDVIVGGADQLLAAEMMHLARKKNGREELQNLITNEIAKARAQGAQIAKREADTQRMNAITEQRQRFDEMIVCSFLAEVAHAEQQYKGLPRDMIWNVPSLTVSKIVDVLNAAGYYAAGKRN